MSLIPRFVLGDLDLTDHPFLVEWGSDLGNPETDPDVMAALLADGEIETAGRRSNRTITLPLLIEGADPAALADAEAALIAECDKPRNVLRVEPGDGMAPATVFDTFAADAQRAYDDDLEVAGYRRWQVTLRALPYSRSAGKIVDIATSPPGAGSGAVFESCESTTGWASYGGDLESEFTVDATLYVEGTGSIRSKVMQWEPGYVYNTGNGTGGYYSPNGGTSRDQITGLSLDTGDGGYITAAIRFDPTYDASALTRVWQSTTPGAWTEVPTFAAIKMEANGFVHYRWEVDAAQTIIGLRFEATHGTKGQGPYLANPYVWFDDFRILPTASTEQQIVKNLDVEGSARTVGSLRVGSGTESVALGQVLVVTVPTAAVPAGFNPEGRPWVTQGTLAADSTALNGSYYSPDATTYSTAAGVPIFDIPVRLLTPGAYNIVTLVKTSSGTVTSGVQAQLNVNGALTGPTSTAEVTLPSETTDWQFVTVGTAFLPPVPVEGADSSTTVRLLFKGASLANVYMIPAWQVNGFAVADFSIVDCGTGLAAAGGPSSYLWIDSPSTEQPQGGWWRGPTSDRMNTRSAWPDARKPGTHTFAPGDLTAFLVTTGAQAPTLALEYYPAWYGNAAL